MFTFRDMTANAERMAWRIRRILASRNAMRFEELLARMGDERAEVLKELEAMIDRGEVERLRPVGCPDERLDFFRLDEPDEKAVPAGEGWIRKTHGCLTGI